MEEKASLGRRRLIKPRAGVGQASGAGAAGTKALGQRAGQCPDHRSFTPHPSRRALSSNCRDNIFISPSFSCGGGPGRSEMPSRSWHLSSRTSRTCGVCRQVHSPPGGRATRAPGAVNVRLASWTATPRRNLIERASLRFPASYREVQSPRGAGLTGFTGLRPGGDQRPPPPNPASSAPAAAPAGANRSSPASPPRRAGRHAAAADQWRG